MISRSALSSTCTTVAEPSLPIATTQALSRIERLARLALQKKRPTLEPAPAVEYSLCTFLYIHRPRWLFSFGALCFFGGGLDLRGCAFEEFPLDLGGLDSRVLFS